MKKKKYLLIGIACAVVILAVLLGLVLTQCAGGQGEDTTPSTDAVGAAESYTLYWNLDRGIYGGKSEAGMSSRKPEADGIYYVRFFQDGEELTLKVTDRKLINAIDHEDVMGLDVDEDGFVTAVYTLDELPLERVGWRFSVQSAARTTIKLNSSENFDGMEILLEDLDPNGICPARPALWAALPRLSSMIR